MDVIYVCSSKVLSTVVSKFSCGLGDGQMAGYGQAQSAGGEFILSCLDKSLSAAAVCPDSSPVTVICWR